MNQLTRLAIAATIPLLASPLGIAQTPKFKTQSSAVVVDVIVTDSKGNVVPGLTANDFKIFENNTLQKIIGFETPEMLPAATRSTRPETTGTASSTPPASAEKTAPPKLRFVTLVVDIGDIRTAGLEASIKAATEYIEKGLGPGDFAGLYSIGSKLRLVVPFTRDKAKLIEGIQSLNQHSNDGVYTAKDRDREQAEMNRLSQNEAELNAGDAMDKAMAQMVRTERLTLQSANLLQQTFQARAVFVALRSIAQSAATLPGRKNVIVFSEGFAHSPEAGVELSAVVDASNRANVSIYVVDPAGLTGSTLASGFKAESSGAMSAPGRRGARQVATDSDTEQQAELMRQGSRVNGGYSVFDMIQRVGVGINYDDLQTVAESTGGFLIKDRNSLLSSLERIDRDSREYYTLTYQTQNHEYDGAFRSIKVTLANNGYKLRYRKGYWAIEPGEEMTLTPAAAQLLASAANGSLKASLAARMNASLQLAPVGFAVPVSVWIKGDASTLTKVPDGFATGLVLVVVARNAQGELVDVAQRSLNLHFTKDGVKEYERAGIKLTAMLRVPRLELLNTQAVVQFSNGIGATGKFALNLPAQEIGGARPTMLLLTQRVDAAKPNEAPDALRLGDYQLVLPTQNVFAPTDKLTLYFGVDEVAQDKPNLKLDLVLKSGGNVVKKLPTDTLYPFTDSKTRVFFLSQFDLNGLAPGGYTIEASVDNVALKTHYFRASEFSIQ